MNKRINSITSVKFKITLHFLNNPFVFVVLSKQIELNLKKLKRKGLDKFN